jgi:hypothetical protein
MQEEEGVLVVYQATAAEDLVVVVMEAQQMLLQILADKILAVAEEQVPVEVMLAAQVL